VQVRHTRFPPPGRRHYFLYLPQHTPLAPAVHLTISRYHMTGSVAGKVSRRSRWEEGTPSTTPCYLDLLSTAKGHAKAKTPRQRHPRPHRTIHNVVVIPSSIPSIIFIIVALSITLTLNIIITGAHHGEASHGVIDVGERPVQIILEVVIHVDPEERDGPPSVPEVIRILSRRGKDTFYAQESTVPPSNQTNKRRSSCL
jgi:hypothetical protein